MTDTLLLLCKGALQSSSGPVRAKALALALSPSRPGPSPSPCSQPWAPTLSRWLGKGS